jgi:hypothetical protein
MPGQWTKGPDDIRRNKKKETEEAVSGYYPNVRDIEAE